MEREVTLEVIFTGKLSDFSSKSPSMAGKWTRASSPRWDNGLTEGRSSFSTSLRLHNYPRKIVNGPITLSCLGSGFPYPRREGSRQPTPTQKQYQKSRQPSKELGTLGDSTTFPEAAFQTAANSFKFALTHLSHRSHIWDAL